MAEHTGHNHDGGTWGSRVKLAFAVFAVIGGFFLIAEHRAHVLPFLPWLLLAACPLMHLFMHGKHGGHGGNGGDGGHAGHGDGGAADTRSEGSRAPSAETPRRSDAAQGGLQHHDGGRP